MCFLSSEYCASSSFSVSLFSMPRVVELTIIMVPVVLYTDCLTHGSFNGRSFYHLDVHRDLFIPHIIIYFSIHSYMCSFSVWCIQFQCWGLLNWYRWAHILLWDFSVIKWLSSLTLLSPFFLSGLLYLTPKVILKPLTSDPLANHLILWSLSFYLNPTRKVIFKLLKKFIHKDWSFYWFSFLLTHLSSCITSLDLFCFSTYFVFQRILYTWGIVELILHLNFSIFRIGHGELFGQLLNALGFRPWSTTLGYAHSPWLNCLTYLFW